MPVANRGLGFGSSGRAGENKVRWDTIYLDNPPNLELLQLAPRLSLAALPQAGCGCGKG